MQNVFKVKSGDVVILSVNYGAFLQTNPSLDALEKRINESVKEVGIKFVVVPNVTGVKVLETYKKAKPNFEDGV